MIFYLANPPWKPGVGGETGLYTSMTDPVDAAASAVPPVNNTMLIFENTPESFHSFISNTKQTRNSLILWLHRTVEETNRLWPSEPLYSWKQKKAS
jgi:Rps23 Pro-64 3,4-dihydroxylase Tpa1-like proline 4-hydroxylase